MRLVAVIPAYNEAPVIASVVRETLPHVDEVIVVDNNSSDATASEASSAGARVVSEPRAGYGTACMAGADAATDADVLVFLDGDGSDPPAMIPLLLEVLQRDGVDLVLGRRAGDVEPGSILWHQQAGNWLMALFVRALSGGWPLHDLPSYKLIRIEAYRGLALTEMTHGWTAEFLMKAALQRLSMREVKTGYRRRVGVSKVSGTLKGSALAAYRLNRAIFRTWLQARKAGASTTPAAARGAAESD